MLRIGTINTSQAFHSIQHIEYTVFMKSARHTCTLIAVAEGDVTWLNLLCSCQSCPFTRVKAGNSPRASSVAGTRRGPPRRAALSSSAPVMLPLATTDARLAFLLYARAPPAAWHSDCDWSIVQRKKKAKVCVAAQSSTASVVPLIISQRLAVLPVECKGVACCLDQGIPSHVGHGTDLNLLPCGSVHHFNKTSREDKYIMPPPARDGFVGYHLSSLKNM